MSETTTAWPPSEGVFTPVVPRSDVIFPLHASAIVNAPASVVWQTLLDTSQYAAWNSFVPKVTIQTQEDASDSPILKLGTLMTFHAVMDPKKPNKESPTVVQVMDVSTPENPSKYVPDEMLQDPVFTADLSKVYRISWKVTDKLLNHGLRSERFHEIIVLDDSRCELRNWECMSGVLARTIKWMYGSVLPIRCNDWIQDLKRESEKRASQAPQ